jgi:hypothetical protein
MGKKRKCVYCGERAVAYRIESSGDKTMLCYDHVPITADLDSSPSAQNEQPMETRICRAFGLRRFDLAKK